MTSKQTDPDLQHCISRQDSEVCRKSGIQLINIRVVDPVHKADAGTLVRILVGQLNMHFPCATREGCCKISCMSKYSKQMDNQRYSLSSGPLKRT